MGFVEREILPRYNQFGHSHGMAHVQRVIKNALELVASTGADINMVYVIAAYHDLGMEGPRAIHHLTGGKMLAADMRLRRWFSAEQIRIMKEAVEDHRASASHAPRSIYGMIVAEADRDSLPGPLSMAWRTTPSSTRWGSGNALTVTWRRNTAPMVTSSCGFQTRPMRNALRTCARSLSTSHVSNKCLSVSTQP